jgi:cell division protein ZapE
MHESSVRSSRGKRRFSSLARPSLTGTVVLPVDLHPPTRFDSATFASYRAQTPSQEDALRAVRQFADHARAVPTLGQRMRRLFSRSSEQPKGLYLVGPVGTGKTHLLAAACHSLTPEVSCGFLHSNALFRLREHPARFAEAVANRCEVLCLDEVEIDDPANEARLVLVLQTLEQRGVRLLATSNVEPEQFLSNKIGPGRFRRFLRETFREQYRVLFVGGEDYRRRQRTKRPGRGWVGPPDVTGPAIRTDFERNGGASKNGGVSKQSHARWLPFADLRRATTETPHPALMRSLLEPSRLYVPGIRIRDTDDALRLLRVIDDLYQAPNPPAFYFSAESPPEAWFDPSAHAGIAQAVAEKFERTVSRLYDLCEVTEVGDGGTTDPIVPGYP